MAAVGSSLVTDVLQKTGRLEKDDLQTSVGKLTHKVDCVKTQIYSLVLKQYAEFSQSYDLTTNMNSKVEALSTEMNSLSKKIQGEVETKLQKASNLYLDLSKQLLETNVIIDVLGKLCQIQDLLSELSDLKIHHNYLKIAQALEKIKSLLDQIPRSGAESKVFRTLRAEYLNENSELLHTLDSKWNKCFSWRTTTTPSWDNIDGHYQTKLIVSKGDKAGMKLALHTMQYLNLLQEKLSKFGKRFLQFVIKPIIIFPRLKPIQNEKSETFEFTFGKDASKSSNSGTTTLLQKIGEVFDSLNVAFMNQTVPASGNDTEEITLAAMLGVEIWSSMSDDIIKYCLAKCAGNSSSEAGNYEETLSGVDEFESNLIQSGYLASETDTLRKYCQNMATHYSNKKCQDLLFRAREMLKTNVTFHNSKLISIPEKHRPISPLHTPYDKKTGDTQGHVTVRKSGDTSTEAKRSENLFYFPTCRVSECIPEFLDVVYKTLVEATESKTSGDVRLFYTARNMFELYHVVVPAYYEEDLRELPQISALHYNNCMYLTHHLLTLGHQFRTRLPQSLDRGSATFVDMISPIRSLGENCFEDQLRRQSHVLLDILESGGGFVDLSPTLMEKSIKQICYQLLKLSRVWKDILPENIYKSAMGSLLNIALKTFLDDILKLEDISSNDSSTLHNLMGIFVEKSPEAIQIPTEHISGIVPNWTKFLELRCIIDSSLQNIEDRWKDGKGPLAKEFSCNEIRGLVRALFQNTDRRASVLNKIRPV